MIGASPPSPFMCGSTTCRTRPAATAASNAVPPASSTAIPDAVASQWVEATMPKLPASCGRVVNEEPCGSISSPEGVGQRGGGRGRDPAAIIAGVTARANLKCSQPARGTLRRKSQDPPRVLAGGRARPAPAAPHARRLPAPPPSPPQQPRRTREPPMRPSAHAARRISAAAALLCTGALAAACGSTSSSNNSAARSPASTAASSASPAASAAASSAQPTTGPTTPPSTPSVAACSTSDLSGAVNTGQGGAAAGSTYYPLNLTNTSKSSCYLFGYPGVSFVTGPSGSQIGEPASRNPAVAPRTVIQDPGGTAHVTVQVVDALNYSKSDCQPVTAHWLKVFPPGQFTALYVKFTATTCSAKLPAKLGVPLTVDAVKGGAGQPGQGL